MIDHSIFDQDPLPFALVKESELDHNIASFASYCRERHLDLAPHVKTTMSRQIFERQLAGGAWGATVATVAQARRAMEWGARRILIAAQVTDQAGLRELVGASSNGVELFSWVDSPEGLKLIERTHERSGSDRPVRLLIELGHERGRSGLRDDLAAAELSEAVASSASCELWGVAAFEGTVAGGRAGVGEVDTLLGRMIDLDARLRADGLFAAAPSVLTVGGSVFFDRVAEHAAKVSRDTGRVVLRSGCYVTHDCGIYDELSPLGSGGADVLRPALEVWGAVISVPEPGLAIANIGRRDVSFDAGLPLVVRRRAHENEQMEKLLDPLEITALNDQHAFIADPRSKLTVGDLIGTCISHPCTTFDKWRELALVDTNYRRVGTLTTEF